MLADCVGKCPEDQWTSGTYPRYFWRIAFHAAFFTHLYLGQNYEAFQPWPGRQEWIYDDMWSNPAYVEPYELPDSAEVFSQQDMLSYIAYVDGLVGPIVDALDLDVDESGFSWYENFSKLSHQLMNIAHINSHVGQLSELLMAKDIEIEWIPKRGYT